ncbi:MAG: IPExxxVDY family protein [Owenweeksia sp.]|nr:IPExxxVDY family protein [Owenweeksia sp.]
MAQKLSLDNDFQATATIFGLITDLPDYRLVFFLNQLLGLQLCRTKDDKELFHKAGKISFSEFHYYEPVSMLSWWLTANKNGLHYSHERDDFEIANIPLVHPFRTMNYFLWYEEDDLVEINQQISTQLRKSPHIRAIQKIDQTAHPQIQNLIAPY